MIRPISVRGMTLRQLEDALRHKFTQEKSILRPGRERILVSLQRPRTYPVLVIRQESGTDLNGGAAAGSLNLGAIKRGTGKVVKLPAYKNDVLHALAETGGLPGLDAENTIYIIRSNNPSGLSTPQPQRPTPVTRPRLPESIPVPPQSPGWTPPGGYTAPQGMAPSNNYIPNSIPPAIGPSQIGIQYQGGFLDQTAVTQSFIQQTSAEVASNNSWGHSQSLGSVSQSGRSGSSAGLPAAANLWGHSQPLGAVSQSSHAGFAGGPLSPHSQRVPKYPDPVSYQQFPPTNNYSVPAVVSGADWYDSRLFRGNQQSTNPQNREPVKIPIRLLPGEQVDFSPSDVVLGRGDIVFIESRETEIFYTGGLLGGGQYTLPRVCPETVLH